MEVQPADRAKTASITSEGLYEFNVLPFRLMYSSPVATFQRLMSILLLFSSTRVSIAHLFQKTIRTVALRNFYK